MTHFVVQQALKTLVDGERLELVGDDHAHEGTHGGVHAARRSADVDDRQSLVLNTQIQRTDRSRSGWNSAGQTGRSRRLGSGARGGIHKREVWGLCPLPRKKEFFA